MAVTGAALRQAQARANTSPTLIVALAIDVNEWQAVDVAVDMRKALGIGSGRGRAR